MRYTTLLAAAVLAASSLLSGCITADSANVYHKDEMKRVAKARAGKIESMRTVEMADSTSGVGSIAGAVIGGVVAANNVGKGTGSVVSGVLGSLLGGWLGNQAENQITRKPAKELTVAMQDNGERLVIVQDADQPFAVGQTVDVITDGVTARVTIRQ
ncbi:glycine zipper domain-containing protein [Chitinibacter tainanensis]|uniref:glycine zipper domain-containing protein n=1 Tax=Chitinibacter tainanensis TaxID=230667 RepID=UPI0003F675A9|nr:glycine zipper domain-containing protein [Chitinibacter tainanensis]